MAAKPHSSRYRRSGKNLFRNLKRVAQTLDSINGGEAYQKVCDELVACFDNPQYDFSAVS
ncbi:hypothetical protein ACNKHW_16880 [Shigella flexneri]